MIAVTDNNLVFISEFQAGFRTTTMRLDEFINSVRAQGRRLEFVGRKADFDPYAYRRLNPRQFLTQAQFSDYRMALSNGYDYPVPFRKYNRWTNNCQHHAWAVRNRLGVR